MADDKQYSSIADNLARVRERIARAAERAGRRPEQIRLVAVTKTVPAARVKEALAAGVTDIGENYVQEAAAKHAEIGAAVTWHFIGHLQRNKAGQAARLFDIIHTVDSVRLAEALSRRAQQLDRRLEVLIQVNTSGEATKAGVPPDEAAALVEKTAALDGLAVTGLMTIGRLQPDPELARPEFRLLAALAERLRRDTGLDLPWLSMGMSHDFEVAIDEGATIVRVGTAIFGPRRN